MNIKHNLLEKVYSSFFKRLTLFKDLKVEKNTLITYSSHKNHNKRHFLLWNHYSETLGNLNITRLTFLSEVMFHCLHVGMYLWMSTCARFHCIDNNLGSMVLQRFYGLYVLVTYCPVYYHWLYWCIQCGSDMSK